MSRSRYPQYTESGVQWLQAVPSHWTISPLGSHFDERAETVSDAAFPPLSVTKDGVVPQMETVAKTANNDSRKLVRAGDFAINSRSDRKGSAGVSELDGSVSVVYTVLTPRRSLYRPFVHHLLRSSAFQEEFYRWGNGIVADLWSTRYSAMKRIPLAVPPLEEQIAIAHFLDVEVAKVDELIAEQVGLVDVLRERRVALIRHIVPSPLAEPSGTDRLSRFTRIGNGSTPRRENLAYWEGGDFPWLNSAVVNQRRVMDSDQYVTEAALTECHLPVVPRGSILVGLTGQGRTRGMATVLGIDATVSQHVAYVTPDGSRWDSEYLRWALTAAYADLRALSDENGSTKGGLTCEDLKRFRLVRPEVEEQRRLADYLDDETAKIDALIVEAEGIVTVAKERRSALITAAVTGQIDVRGEVA